MMPKILIVDDKPENLVALEKVLAGSGATIVRAESGNEALTLLLDEEFALALVDIQMPGMDGFEMVEIMRQQEKTRFLPVIFVSAIYREESHHIKGIETGAVDFINKPIVPQILVGKVRIFLDLYRQKKELEHYTKELEERESIFHVLATGQIGMTDDEIFADIIKSCENIFKAENVLIGRFSCLENIDVCAMLKDGEKCEDIDSYTIYQTPFEKILDKGFSYNPEKVCSLFPHDSFLATNKIESSLGITVRNRHGESIGVLALFSKKTITPPDFAKEILDILSLRVATVLEWQDSDQERQELQTQLQQAQKMEAIGTLAGGIAHDFNNILTAIIGFTDLARMETPEKTPLSDYLFEIMKAGNRAKELVTQILAFSRHSLISRSEIQIQPILKESLKLLRATLPSTIKIELDLDEDCGCIFADPTQIHQVIMNLCTNAYQSMKDSNGILSVTLRRTDIDNEDLMVRGYELTPGSYLNLLISDTGCGMEKDVINRIFDPYFTTKKQGEGTGMGLSVVHGIVKGHRGSISVYSEPGIGSTFCIYLPEIKNVTPHAEESAESASLVPDGTERVMVVDDESQIILMIKTMLDGYGYSVSTFLESKVALETFLENPDSYDLVITDMTMPEMTGLEMSEKILKARPDMPIILCSGHGMPDMEKKVKTAGVKEYLTKPLILKNLAQKVRKVLNESQG